MGLFDKFLKKKKNDPDFVGYTDKVRGYPDRDSIRYLLSWLTIDRKLKIVKCKDDSVFSVMEFRGPDMDSSTNNDLLGIYGLPEQYYPAAGYRVRPVF